MHIYLNNNLAKFHPNPGFFQRALPQQEKNNKMSSDMVSVPDPKLHFTVLNLK